LKYGLNENKTFIFIFKMKRSLRAEKTVAAARDFQILVACCTFFVHITLCAGAGGMKVEFFSCDNIWAKWAS
jgi:hypothetical protein